MLMWTGTTSDSVLYQQITCSPPKVVEKETSNKVALAVTATWNSTLLLEFSTMARQSFKSSSKKHTQNIHIINDFFWWILQGLIEGMKAYRGENGRVLLFRPELNAMRMKKGAERMCMHSPSVQQFIEGVKQTVLANRRWVKHSIFVFILISVMRF